MTRAEEPDSKPIFKFRARNRELLVGRRTAVMGVVNVTPDSFSDGGAFGDPARAVDRCLELASEGADILDIGGESSRPGAVPVALSDELRRVLPVVSAVRGQLDIPISVDTYKSAVARAALEEGADVINDISAFRLDPGMPRVVAAYEAGVVLMHMRGVPENMQKMAPSPDIIGEIKTQLEEALAVAYSHRIERDRIVLDPGIGFGKTVDDNLRILNRLSALAAFGFPIMVGTSRKSFLGRILDGDETGRMWGTASSVVVSIVRGAHIVRVHDVRQIRMVAAVADAILSETLE